MISQLTNLNWISVLLAFIAYFMLGYAWYMVLFDKQYKASLGKSDETLPTNPIFIAGPAVCCLVYTVTSAILINILNIQSFMDTLAFSLVVGIGYLVTNTVNIAINPNISRPIFYGVITGSYHLVGFSIANIILFTMK